MEKINEKEFSIGNILNLLIIKNDVIEMKFTSLISNRNIIIISFYDSEKNRISQKNLKFLCNHKNIVFDNILIISNLKEETPEYKLKIFNKNISQMKLYIQTFNNINKSENFFSQIFDLNVLKILTKEEVSNLSLNKEEKSTNLNLIISELDKVNKSLNERKNELDRKENEIKNIENNINKQKKIIEQKIIQFKEEILLFKDKCYGEYYNEVNNKMRQLTKKLNTVENNVNNKYKILKEKLANNNSNNKINNNYINLISQEKKEKIANLEIKIKFLEDSINKYKEKNQENEQKIKNYISNEEKLNSNIKKLKDELILTNNQMKEKKLKMSSINSNMSISNISIIESKEKDNTNSSTTKNKKIKNKISFDLDKNQKEIISKYHIYNILFEYKIIPNNYMDKEILSTGLLLMHLSTNPISLNNKFDLSHIIFLEKLISYINLNNVNSFISLVKQNLEDLFNKLPEFKNNISAFVTNNNYNKNNFTEFRPLIDININEINLSSIIFNKCINFGNFISKNNSAINVNNERKNKIKKFIIISNLLISLLFCSNRKGMKEIIEKINSFFINYNRDDDLIKFLTKINLGKIFILIFEKINIEDNDDLKNNIHNCILYYISMISNTNINDFQFFSIEKKLENYLKRNIKGFINFFEENKFPMNDIDDNFENIKNNFLKSIILITNLSIHCPNLRNKIKEMFSDNISDIQNLMRKTFNKRNEYLENKFVNYINRNVSILSRIINIKN